jgi:asparagine synthase (glutamine-hydrolysing)
LRDRVRASLLGGQLADSGIFEQATIKRLIEQHENGLRDHSTPLWTLLMYEAFLRNTMV